MPTLITDPSELITTLRAATVEVKTSLDEVAWSDVPHLYCDKLTLSVNAYDEARLSYELGSLLQPGTNTYDVYTPLNLLGKFVKITAEQDDPLTDITWVGYVVGTANERSAVKGASPLDNKLTGRKQTLVAVGLEYFLDRVQIDSAVIYNQNRIQRSIPFNGGQGVALDADTRTRANRSAATNLDSSYAFVPPDEAGTLWTLDDIINYLCTYFATRNSANAYEPTNFLLDPTDVLDGVVAGISPTFNPDGLTAFQVLNRLLAPQRGFVWWVEFRETGPGTHHAAIRVETLATSAITLPSTGDVPANRDQQTLDFDKERDVEDVIVAEAGSRVYHKIIVRGARMTSTCTLGVGELIEGWTPTNETEYKDAASATTGYGGLTTTEQKKRNDAFRKADRFYRVYSAFRIDPEWDGKSGDGDEGTRDWTFPELEDDGTILGGLTFSVAGLRLLPFTRLKRGWDYSDTDNIEETSPTGDEAEYQPSFGIMQVASTPDKYQFVHKLNEHNYADGSLVSDNISVTYEVRAQQTVPGIVLDASKLQHAAALNHWTSAEPSSLEPQVDYDTLRITTTLEADTYAEGSYPADEDLPANTALQKLVLYVGDNYRLDFLAENTVVGLDNGEPVLTNGGVLRDDRPNLNDIARVAHEWYQLDRLPITVNFRQVRNIFRLGMMITQIGEGTTSETVNTVVSVLSYDFKNGMTTIKTNDEDLDLKALA